MKRFVQFKQVSSTQLQGVFIRSIDRANPIIQVRRSRVFDVISEYVRHMSVLSEISLVSA
jgi:hypothetical protein